MQELGAELGEVEAGLGEEQDEWWDLEGEEGAEAVARAEEEAARLAAPSAGAAAGRPGRVR